MPAPRRRTNKAARGTPKPATGASRAPQDAAPRAPQQDAPRAQQDAARKGRTQKRAAKTAAPGSEPAGDAEIAATLAGSLQSTRDGLQAFARMVDGSRMRQALPQYEQLASVLVEQRTWAAANRAALDQPFAEVAEAARRLHEVFAGYAAAFERIARLSHAPRRRRSHPRKL